MKKRLISMLMAVLMIASLLPTVVFAADDNTAGSCEHKYTTVSIKKDAEKKTPSVEFKVCKYCGEIKTDSISISRFEVLLFHKCSESATMVAQEASCHSQGLTVSYCKECGKALGNDDFNGATYEIKAALKHVFDEFQVVQKPTCTVDGWGYAVCKLCKDPEFVAGPDEAAAKLDFANFNNDITAFGKRVDAVKAMFAASNPSHDEEGLVTVTRVITNFVNDENETVTLYPAEERGHDLYKISGKYDATATGDNKNEKGDVIVDLGDNKTTYAVKYVAERNGDKFTFTAEEVDPDHGGKGRTADKYCPVCHKVFEGETAYAKTLDEEHEIELVTKGYAPYVKADGTCVDGKTDVWACSTCVYSNGTPMQFGGKTLSYKDYFNPSANDVPDKTTFTVSAVAPACAKTGTGTTGYTSTTLIYNATAKQWQIKSGGTAIEPQHSMVKQYGLAPDCENPGYLYNNYKVCSSCGYEEGSSTNITQYSALGHKIVDKSLYDATCQHKGFSVKYCTVCNEYIDADKHAIGTSGNDVAYTITDMVKHTAADKLANVKEATCTAKGYTGDKVCKFCGTVMEAGKETNMLDHTPKEVAAKAATCTEPGVSKGTVCSVCNKILSAQETIPALGHKTEVQNAKEATCTEAGYTGDTVCTVCKETIKKGEEIKALDHNYVNGVCTRCDAKKPGYMPFTDVKTGEFYYNAVMWAYTNDVTKGTSSTTFGVNDGCTRAQIVTFLWRAAGSPAPKTTTNPFTDIVKGDYYDAILWAVENGITKGTSATTFEPNSPCTRGQIVTFLWRYEKSPVVSTISSFKDVPTGEYYYNAVNWAVANGITNGTGGGKFSPDAPCTRAQAVTFLHRDFVK